MRRQGFLPILILMITLLPTITIAQTEPIGVVADTPNELYRRYKVLESDVATIIGGQPTRLYSLGYIETSSERASSGLTVFTSVFSAFVDSGLADLGSQTGLTIHANEPRVVDVAQLGDESIAYMANADFGIFDVEFGAVLVRQSSWLQMLMTVAFNDDGGTVQLLEQIALKTESRWPNEEPISVRPDGLRTGGIWSVAALPEDVPPHLELDETYEEGPGPDPNLPGVPSSAEPTRTPAGTLRGDLSSRLAQPLDVTFRIVLAGTAFNIDDQGFCRGAGAYGFIWGGGELSLSLEEGIELAKLDGSLGTGTVSYDQVLNQEVCVFEITFVDVPPRSNYVLTAYTVVISEYEYSTLASGEVIEIVIGQ